MSSASSASKKLYQDILLEVRTLKNEISTNQELLHLVLQQLNDLSVKKDLEINMFALKNDSEKMIKKKATNVLFGGNSEKKKMNIMAYFKRKFTEDPMSLYNIISEEEIEAVLKSKERELKLKKKGNLEQAKATIIYKELISGNKEKQTRLRAKKEQEEEASVVLEEEIIEYDVEEEKQEQHVVEEDNEEDEEESYTSDED